MAHVPHLYLPGPWQEPMLPLDAGHRTHLERVLKRQDGDQVTYTDGAGRVGDGSLQGAMVVRGVERMVGRGTPLLTIAVAAPGSKERARFLVEKLGELGVDRIVWLETRFGAIRPPRVDRATSWLVSSLEQSRGAWLTRIEDVSVRIGDLEGAVWFADRDGGEMPEPPQELTLAVGPEGGWAEGEIPDDARTVSFSGRVLRVETAAVVGAAGILAKKAHQIRHSEW